MTTKTQAWKQTTEAQKRALLTLVYPKLVSSARVNREKVGNAHISVKRPQERVYSTLIDMGLATFTWERQYIHNVERDVRVLHVSPEGKQVARDLCRQELARMGFPLKNS